MAESAEAATEPSLATPPRSAPQPEDAGPGRTNDQDRSNGSSQGEPETRGGDPADSNGDGRAAKPRPAMPRPEGTVNCPRCTSVDTKFCYYNNYNVKQPRYFCKVRLVSRPLLSRGCGQPPTTQESGLAGPGLSVSGSRFISSCLEPQISCLRLHYTSEPTSHLCNGVMYTRVFPTVQMLADGLQLNRIMPA